MPQTVSIPDFGDIDFPDGMPPEEIQKHIRDQVFDLAPLPHADVTDLNKDQFLDRRHVANHNLSFAFQDLQRASDDFDVMAKDVQAGTGTISPEDLDKASSRVKFLQSRFKLAQDEGDRVFGNSEKKIPADRSPWFENFKASFAQSGETLKAAGADLLTPDAPTTELEDARARLEYARNVDAPSWAPVKDPAYIKRLEQELESASIVPNEFQKDDPRYQARAGARAHFQRLADEHRQEAAGMFQNFAASELSQNAGAQFGRGAGKVLPAMAIGAINLPAAAAQMAADSYETTYGGRREYWKAEGKTDAESDDLAQKEATEATLKAVPQLAAYTIGGKLVSGAVAKFLPNTSPLLRGIVGTAGAGGLNATISASLGHYTDGNRIEQLTQDLAWGALHGKGEFNSAREALDIVNGSGTTRGGQHMQQLMEMSVDNRRSQLADALEREGGAENIQKAKALRFQESEDQRAALKQVEDLRTAAARSLGKAGKPILAKMADAKFADKPEIPADDPFTAAMKEGAPKVGPATSAAVADLTGDTSAPAKPMPAVMATPTPTVPPKPPEPTPPAPVAPEPAAPEAAPAEPPTETHVADLTPVQVPLSRITLSTDVPQFKKGADAKGIVEPLGAAKFDKRDVGPIQLWERLDGRLEVISGRHRFDLAQRTGEKDISAQIHREADGFTAQQAAMLDAELNIRDQNGSVSDFANYFRHSGITEGDAESRGLLDKAKGKQGFSIGTRASEDLFALHQSGQITDAKASAIVGAAGKDHNLQRLALRYTKENPNAGAGEIGHFLNATAAFQKLGHVTIDEQGELFGQSDASLNAANRAAEVAKELEAKAKEDARILQTALNRTGQLKLTKEEAARFGIADRNSETEIRAALKTAKVAAEGWDSWHLDDAKKAAVFGLAGVKGAEAPQTGQGEAPARAATPADDLFASRSDSPFKLTAESAAEKAAREAREQREALDREEAQRVADKAAAEKQQGGIFDKPPAAPPSKEPAKSNIEPVEPPKASPAATLPPGWEWGKDGKPHKMRVAPAKAEPTSKERVRLGSSPQTYTIEEKLPAQKGDLPGETYYRVKNERTGEEQTVEAKDLRRVGKKGKQSVDMEAAAENTLAKVPDAPGVEVFESAADIPPELGGDAPNVRQAKADGNIIEGWHAVMPDGRRVIVLNKDGIAKIAEQMGISVEERAHQVTLHELGHDRQHLGALLPAPERRAYNSVVDGVISRDQATAAEIAKLYGYDLGSVTGRAKTAEEMIVREGEKEKPAAWYHRAIAALVDIFRTLGYKGKLTESELRTMLDYANRGRFDARKRAGAGEISLSQQRAQVGGEPGVGHEYNVRDIATTKEAVRAGVFDSTQPVSDANTGKAWDLIESLTDLSSGRAHTTAGDIVQAAGNDMGTALAKVELMNYAAKLAGQGDPTMINHLLGTVNLMPNTQMGSGESTAGAVLRARKELDSGLWKQVIGASQAADVETARMLAGRAPTNADIDFIRQLKAEIAGAKGKPVEGDDIPGGEDLGDKLKKAGVQIDNPMLQAMIQIARNGYENGTRFTFTASNEPVASASEERRAAVGKLIQQGATDEIPGRMAAQGAGGLEHAFWRQIDAPAEEGLLSQLDRAQNAQLANVVKDVLTRMGIEPPKGNKLTDAEKVATMLNERPLDAAKRKIADERIRTEIEERRKADLAKADDDDERSGIDAYYSNLRDAWDTANRRATDMPVSDSLLRRLVNTELKSKDNPAGVDFTAAVRTTDPREVAAARKTVVDGVLAKVNAASWPGRDYSTLRGWLEGTWDRMHATRKAKWDASVARAAAKKAAGTPPDDTANFMIQSFARSQSDTPSWPANQENAVRKIVRDGIQEHGPQNERNAWLADMKGKLMGAGVSEPVADSLAARVLREREIRESDRIVRAHERAAESGPLAPLVDAINSTPLRNRTGDWMEKTIRDYLMNAGLSEDQARQAGQSFAPAIRARMEEAQVKAFEDSVKASDLYKSRVEREPAKAKTDLDKLKGAVRSGAADPTNTFTGKIAALNGWKQFTPAQYARLAELDAVHSDPQALPYKRSQAAGQMLEIARQAGAKPGFLRTLNEFYTAQALSGIPTDSINVASPALFLVRDAITDAVSSAWKGVGHLENTWKALRSALDGYAGELAFAAVHDSYSHHTNEWFDHQSALKGRVEAGFARLKAPKGVADAAGAVKEIVLGIGDYVRRTLSTLDQGAISVLEQYNLSRYGMDELRRRGLGTKAINMVLETVIEAKSRFYADARAKGMSYAEAKTAANDFTRDAWVKALDAQGVKGEDVSLAAINDALRGVGRVGKDSEGNRLRDVGMISSPIMHLIDGLSAISKDRPGVGLVFKMLFGFYATAARTVHGAAWYSPYGFVRLAADRAFKKAGADSPYAQTLATDTQQRARFRDALAGTIALAVLTPLMTTSDKDDKKGARITVTGNGPDNSDPAVRDAWLKKHKPNAIEIGYGDHTVSLNLGRAGEALQPTLALAGAMDDVALRKKHAQGSTPPPDIDTAGAVASSLFYQMVNRGPYSMFTRSGRMFPDKDNGHLAERFAGEVAYSLKPAVPLIGSTLAKNISDLFSGPLDKSSVSAALTANIPFVGPTVNEPALNRLGDPIGDQGFDGKLWRLGVPAAVSLPDNSQDRLAYDLIRRKSQGPPSLDRKTIESRYAQPLTDKQWRQFIQIQGHELKGLMIDNYDALLELDPPAFNAQLSKWAETSEATAATELGLDKAEK